MQVFNFPQLSMQINVPGANCGDHADNYAIIPKYI